MMSDVFVTCEQYQCWLAVFEIFDNKEEKRRERRERRGVRSAASTPIMMRVLTHEGQPG